jgi:hypothetical protein
MELGGRRILTVAPDRAERFRPVLEQFSALSAAAAAAALNERNLPSPRGGRWSAGQVIRMRNRFAASPRRNVGKAFRGQAGGSAKMGKHPIESNFYVNVSDTEVEVTFVPTKSIYTFSRLPSMDLISPNALVRHLGRRGDTCDYEPVEVQAMAYRVALATLKRLRLKPPDLQRWPLVSRK